MINKPENLSPKSTWAIVYCPPLSRAALPTKMLGTEIAIEKSEPMIKAKIRLNTGDYVADLTMNSQRIKLTQDENRAQIFKRPKGEIDKLIKRIPARYEPQVLTA
jgi:hypothetical protein